MFEYLNHSLAKKQTFVHASQNLSEIEIEPGDHRISFSKCQGDPSLPAGNAPWASLAVDRNPPAITGFRQTAGFPMDATSHKPYI